MIWLGHLISFGVLKSCPRRRGSRNRRFDYINFLSTKHYWSKSCRSYVHKDCLRYTVPQLEVLCPGIDRTRNQSQKSFQLRWFLSIELGDSLFQSSTVWSTEKWSNTVVFICYLFIELFYLYLPKNRRKKWRRNLVKTTRLVNLRSLPRTVTKTMHYLRNWRIGMTYLYAWQD